MKNFFQDIYMKDFLDEPYLAQCSERAHECDFKKGLFVFQSLMRSPEVVEHLQLLQRDVSINRLLSTAPVVKTEAEAASAQVKSERNPPEPARPPNTIGHVMVVNIKKESDNSCGIDDQPGRNSPSTDSQEQGKTQNNKDREEQNVTRDFDDRSNNPLDLTAHRADAS